LHAILDWINIDFTVRKHFLPQLIRHVRLPLVQRELLYNNMLLRNDPTCQEVYENAGKEKDPNTPNPIVRAFPRKSAGQPQHIIVFCGDVLTTNIFVFDVVVSISK